jgi:GntR family transcriptional regulator/MocR family aminotransferase
MRTVTASIPQLRLDERSKRPMYRQVYDAIRGAVLSGQLSAGTRLPPQRDLARDLGVSRNTVMMAFEQLIAEGYLEGHVGAGTFVTQTLPDDLLQVRDAATSARRRTQPPATGLSRRGRMLAMNDVSVPLPGEMRPFRIGMPDARAFPFDEWARITSRLWRNPPQELVRYGDPAGYGPLREAIASYAAAARGVRCDAAQVIVVSGSQQALDLSARLLLDPGDRVWMEDPGYIGAGAALRAAGAELQPVPVDEEGLVVSEGERLAKSARAVYVTPSHQFPLSVTMSLPRRLALLKWAAANNAWILEDDYDSEYRYAGRPLASLQGLDERGRVIYIGTFSKVMFPSLRLGYAIVPPGLADAFARARAAADRHPPTVDQAALAEFIAQGHLGRHVRRVRALYQERRDLLVALARRELSGVLDVRSPETGMHTVGWLPPHVDDRAMAARALDAGVDTPPLSAYRLERHGSGALLLGFSAYDARELAAGVHKLSAALTGSGADSFGGSRSAILSAVPAQAETTERRRA